MEHLGRRLSEAPRRLECLWTGTSSSSGCRALHTSSISAAKKVEATISTGEESSRRPHRIANTFAPISIVTNPLLRYTNGRNKSSYFTNNMRYENLRYKLLGLEKRLFSTEKGGDKPDSTSSSEKPTDSNAKPADSSVKPLSPMEKLPDTTSQGGPTTADSTKTSQVESAKKLDRKARKKRSPGKKETDAVAAGSKDVEDKESKKKGGDDEDKIIKEKVGPVSTVSKAQLWSVFVASAVPFVGFGFLDNFLMILAGDVIDATLCVQFSFSTMAAAALGNTFSDIAGVFSGGVVEDIAQRFGIEMPPLTQEQLRETPVKVRQYVGQAFGIIIGCVLGMCPLIWIDPQANEKKKKEKEREEVLKHVVSEVSELLNAEATLMMMVDNEAGDLYTKATEHIPEFRSDLSKGIMGNCARTGKFVNIDDLPKSEFYDQNRHSNYRGTGMAVKSVLCMPVMHMAPEEGQLPVMAVVEVINKKADTGFTQKDEEILAAICSHVAVSLTDDEGKSFKNVLAMCKEQIRNRQQYSTMNPVKHQRQIKLFETLMEESSGILNCEASQLLLIDPVQQKLKAKVAHRLPLREFALEADVMGNVCSTAQLANIADITRTKFYDKSVHQNYLGSGIEVRTVLCVPVINTEHHVIGCMMAINKKSNEMFTTTDIEMLMNISSHVALTLEGEGSSIKKILALAQDQRNMMKQSTDFVRTKTLQAGPILVDVEEEDVDEEWEDDVDVEMTDEAMRDLSRHSSHRDKLLKIVRDNDLLVTLDKAEFLPIADMFGTIDPYITISLVKGDPKHPKYRGPSQGLGYVSPLGWGKSSTITQNQFPEWNEKIRLKLPADLADGYEDVYIHVKLWDWDFMKSDDMIGEMVYPLKRVFQEQAMSVTPFPLTPIRGNPDEYDLKKSKIHIKFTIAKKEKQGDMLTKAHKQAAERGYYEANVEN